MVHSYGDDSAHESVVEEVVVLVGDADCRVWVYSEGVVGGLFEHAVLGVCDVVGEQMKGGLAKMVNMVQKWCKWCKNGGKGTKWCKKWCKHVRPRLYHFPSAL